jgi:raffinose/stachyose/melibiose transport system permease protein
MKRDKRKAFVFLTPSLFIVLAIVYFPLIQSSIYSLFKWDAIGAKEYIGFDNFIRLFKDSNVYLSLKNTLIYTLVYIIGVGFIGFILALIIERRIKGSNIFRFIWFIPVMISQTAVALLWERILDPQFGILNKILELLGLDILQRNWLGDSKIALYVCVAIMIWQYSGMTMIIILSAMEGIPLEVHDAATVDGVNLFQRVRYVILPLIRPILVIVTTLNLINAMKVFDSVFVLTGGGPGWATSVLSILLYRMAFKNYEFGYASAVAVFMSIVIVLISSIYLRFFRYKEEELN